MSESLTAPPKRSRWKYIFIALAIIALILAALWWWHNRAIQPVQLSTDEKAVLEKKLAAVGAAPLPEGSQPASELDPPADADPAPTYEMGKKEFEITERELNGLLNEHTKFGDSVRFELVPGAVHARITTDLDDDLPIVGGKKLKARARFFIETTDGVPQLVLDDLTVWGISLPNDWLGGLKGQNLLGEVLTGDGDNSLAGIKSLTVERGRLLIKLAE